MSERDPVVAILHELDRPVEPRAEFTDALLAQLLESLAETNGRSAQAPARRPRLPLPVQQRWRVLAGALALVAVAAAISAVVLSRPSAASAIDVIRDARRSFASAPPFQATLRVDLNPDGTSEGVPQGATSTVIVSYGGPKRLRIQLVDTTPGIPGSNAPGSYVVFDGRNLGLFDARRNFFNASPAPDWQPLEFLSWRGAYPNWDRVCRGPDSKVLPDAQIAGREARHVRCGNFKGDVWELWIDRETGLLLKVVGQVGGSDYFPGLESSTSAKGGFEVEKVQYNPTFPPDTFRVAGPLGALDYRARLQAAIADIPPFKATVETSGKPAGHVDEISWSNAQTWRQDVVADAPNDPRGLGGPGSFLVSAGGKLGMYNAKDNTYSRQSSSEFGPVTDLLPQASTEYSSANCSVVGHDVVAGQEAVHRRCDEYGETADLWLDASTGLELRKRVAGYELQVRHIEYHPYFAPRTFRFTPPPGSTSAEKAESNPYYKTKLEPGGQAPDWSATRLGGGGFQLSDLKGKPALLLFFADWCGGTDPVCNVFGPLQRAYESAGNKVAIVWVDLQGSAGEAQKVVEHNHLTLPVVVDGPGRSVKAWGIQAWPFWVLLDSEGRVLDARLKPQTESQIEELLAEAR